MARTRVRKRNPFVVIVAIGIALIFVSGSALGLYLSLVGGQSESDLLQKGQDALTAGNYQKAAETFRKVLSQDPHNYAANINLGVVLYSQGKKKQAAVYLKEGLVDNPNVPQKAQIEQMINEGK